MDTVLTMEEDFDFSDDDNDRRVEARRVLKDRRMMIRYEIDKDDRRSGDERRKVKVATNEQENAEIDDQDDVEEDVPNSVIAKIGSLFKR